jgi:predicted nucleic acid binding AN1-type Zn finger protein
MENKNINYCNYNYCNRKLKLINYPCKCKNNFCKLHKLPEQHNCEYDYKENNNKNNKIEQMKCISMKISKI